MKRPAERELKDYSSRWDDYARRQATALAAAIGGGVATALVSIYVAPYFHEATLCALGLWCAGSLAAAGRINKFRCPRCGGLFCSQPGYNNQLTTRCVHCGLPLWDRSDSEGRGLGSGLIHDNPLTESISRSWRRSGASHDSSSAPTFLETGASDPRRSEAPSVDPFEDDQDDDFEIPNRSITGSGRPV